jgi:hypothetical protein
MVGFQTMNVKGYVRNRSSPFTALLSRTFYRLIEIPYGSRPLFSHCLNHHHIMIGSVLLSVIAEDKYMKLKITVTH